MNEIIEAEDDGNRMREREKENRAMTIEAIANAFKTAYDIWSEKDSKNRNSFVDCQIETDHIVTGRLLNRDIKKSIETKFHWLKENGLKPVTKTGYHKGKLTLVVDLENL